VVAVNQIDPQALVHHLPDEADMAAAAEQELDSSNNHMHSVLDLK
jgi:hypothetical protein